MVIYNSYEIINSKKNYLGSSKTLDDAIKYLRKIIKSFNEKIILEEHHHYIDVLYRIKTNESCYFIEEDILR